MRTWLHPLYSIRRRYQSPEISTDAGLWYTLPVAECPRQDPQLTRAVKPALQLRSFEEGGRATSVIKRYSQKTKMSQPSRRRVLSALCAGGSALLAGCTAPSARQDAPFPQDSDSDACPPFEQTDQTVCYGAVDPEELPVVLVPESRTIQPNGATEFTLRNQSDRTFYTNFFSWQLSKRVAGDWYYVAPQAVPQPLMGLPPGEEHTWTMTVETGRVSDGEPIRQVGGQESMTIAGLGGGHYGFGISGGLDSGSGTRSVGLAAGFELNADPLRLVPTDAIVETAWDGDTLVATSNRSMPDGEEEPDEFVLERMDDSATDARQVIAEQVVRNPQLRDTLALCRQYDADRIRLEEYSATLPPFGVSEPLTYEYQADHYRVSARERDSS